MTTLENSYCVPKGEEWDIFGLIPLTGHKVMWLGGEPSLVSGTFNDRTEIPVPSFIDLIHDRIVPWRLEEVGFKDGNGFIHVKDRIIVFKDGSVTFAGQDMYGILTFTDLLTLIRMLTPPSK